MIISGRKEKKGHTAAEKAYVHVLQNLEHIAGWISNCSFTDRRIDDAARTVARNEGA